MIFRRVFGTLGPAIVVAAVVLGPGSILSSSKVGALYGYDMIWVLAVASALMVGTVALSARLGACFDGTLCDELARRAGRPLAVAVGVTMFVVIVCFQASNNFGVLAALDTVFEGSADGGGGRDPTQGVVALVALNGVVIATLYGLRRLYVPLERLMMVLVLVMIAAFAINLGFAAPSVVETLGGLVPSWPRDAASVLPELRGGAIHDPLLPLQAWVATTFSIAGAFYQAYLVREKGWDASRLRQGLVDSIAGIAVLGGVSLLIVVTSAAVFHGRVDPAGLRSASDVARQLEPLFGPGAKLIFALGIFAGAFSSFLVNALIGGTLLADGIGRGGAMDSRWTKALTVAALALGMLIAIAFGGEGFVDVIVFAQALTVVGGPLLAGSLLYLATRADVRDRVPGWMKGIAVAGLLLTVALSIRTAWRVWLSVG